MWSILKILGISLLISAAVVGVVIWYLVRRYKKIY